MKHGVSHIGHDEAGKAVLVQGFDYDEIDRNVFKCEPENDLTQLSPAEMEAAVKALRTVMDWIFQNGMNNPDGLKIRSIVACWVLLQHLRPLTETQMAKGFGLKKQSLGRWVVEWKKSFPGLKIPHFREGKPHNEQSRNKKPVSANR